MRIEECFRFETNSRANLIEWEFFMHIFFYSFFVDALENCLKNCVEIF